MNFINNFKSVLSVTDKIKWIDINKIVIDPELENIFIQKESEIQNIAENMKQKGYDPAHPIVLAFSKNHPELNNINADGHTREKAAIRAGLSKVAVIYKNFEDRNELLKFVYEQQLLRRNLSESEIFNAWQAMNRLTTEDGKKAKTDTEIAEELKISRRQVSKMKEVERKAAPEVLESLKSGGISLNKVYTDIKKAESVNDSDTVVVDESDESSSVSAELAEEKSKSELKAENSNPKSSESKTKYSKEYEKGYATGLNYAFKLLKSGKSLDELDGNISSLKSGSISIWDMEISLKNLMGEHEQKQAE